jgi:hypothetical protein
VSDAEVAPPAACPKCGKKRTADTEACSRCGLIFALWKQESGAPAANLDEHGAELWRKLQDNWSDTALHEELLKHCLQANTLAAAGRLYRERLDDDPKDAIAAQMQGQLLAKATLGLDIGKTQPREAMTRSRWFWVIVLAAMALGILGGLFWQRLR